MLSPNTSLFLRLNERTRVKALIFRPTRKYVPVGMNSKINLKRNSLEEVFFFLGPCAKDFSSVKLSSIVIGTWHLEQLEHVLIFVFYEDKYLV